MICDNRMTSVAGYHQPNVSNNRHDSPTSKLSCPSWDLDSGRSLCYSYRAATRNTVGGRLGLPNFFDQNFTSRSPLLPQLSRVMKMIALS